MSMHLLQFSWGLCIVLHIYSQHTVNSNSSFGAVTLYAVNGY